MVVYVRRDQLLIIVLFLQIRIGDKSNSFLMTSKVVIVTTDRRLRQAKSKFWSDFISPKIRVKSMPIS